MKKYLATMTIVLAGSGSAFAACSHNGVYYEHGAVLCFEGYLQECTVADFWKAIGTCNAPDPRPQLTERTPTDRTPTERMLVAMALDERLGDAAAWAVRR